MAAHAANFTRPFTMATTSTRLSAKCENSERAVTVAGGQFPGFAHLRAGSSRTARKSRNQLRRSGWRTMPSRTPVEIQAELPFGSVRAELISPSPIGFRGSRPRAALVQVSGTTQSRAGNRFARRRRRLYEFDSHLRSSPLRVSACTRRGIREIFCVDLFATVISWPDVYCAPRAISAP